MCWKQFDQNEEKEVFKMVLVMRMLISNCWVAGMYAIWVIFLLNYKRYIKKRNLIWLKCTGCTYCIYYVFFLMAYFHTKLQLFFSWLLPTKSKSLIMIAKKQIGVGFDSIFRTCPIALLGSGSEWPKDQVLLVTMVSYFKK